MKLQNSLHISFKLSVNHSSLPRGKGSSLHTLSHTAFQRNKCIFHLNASATRDSASILCSSAILCLKCCSASSHYDQQTTLQSPAHKKCSYIETHRNTWLCSHGLGVTAYCCNPQQKVMALLLLCISGLLGISKVYLQLKSNESDAVCYAAINIHAHSSTLQ